MRIIRWEMEATTILTRGAGVNEGAPSYMEWYAAFGLMVTLIWLYLEILRLLAKGRRK